MLSRIFGNTRPRSGAIVDMPAELVILSTTHANHKRYPTGREYSTIPAAIFADLTGAHNDNLVARCQHLYYSHPTLGQTTVRSLARSLAYMNMGMFSPPGHTMADYIAAAIACKYANICRRDDRVMQYIPSLMFVDVTIV